MTTFTIDAGTGAILLAIIAAIGTQIFQIITALATLRKVRSVEEQATVAAVKASEVSDKVDLVAEQGVLTAKQTDGHMARLNDTLAQSVSENKSLRSTVATLTGIMSAQRTANDPPLRGDAGPTADPVRVVIEQDASEPVPVVTVPKPPVTD